MVLSLRKIKRISLFFCLFFLFLFILVQLFQLFSNVFPLRSPYQKPYGNAVKVSTNEAMEPILSPKMSWLDRLVVFYGMGE
ncbi:DUF4227 family protein [Shimazuella sp. AN120528]|uniref:DUF4227 family protein n=1 Tax=Shimazuella soli TaxID=1892854 RepID=UPI00210342C8|nr:DUF4227 family protein [Shimazuella soli]MCH5584255.1 DUF4227 family protein [Shimazuella soli]